MSNARAADPGLVPLLSPRHRCLALAEQHRPDRQGLVGGSASEIYERIDFVGQQAFALFAKGKYLEYHGADFGITRKLAAPASGTLVITSPDAIDLDNGAQFIRSDGVIVVAPTGGVLSGAGTLSIAVIASTAALATNTQPGTAFTPLSGVSGPAALSATIVADANGLRGGLDVEPDGLARTSDLRTLRGRILFRKRNPPQGGAPADYVQWASAVPGVTRVYVERLYNGPGSIRVFPIFDDLFASTGGIADEAHIALVRNHIASLEPGAAEVTVAAPAPYPISVAIHGLTPNSSALQEAVLLELKDAFQRLGQVAGNDPAIPAIAAAMPYLATAFTFSAIWVDQAVANTTGEKRAAVTTPATDIVIPAGYLPVLGSVSFS